MANKPRKYQCPTCLEEFTAKERVEGCCPHCNTLLVHKRERGDKGFTMRYVVAEPKTPPTPDREVLEEPQVIERLVSAPNERPEIWLIGEKEGAEHFRVIYKGVIHNDWVYCPSCWRRAFLNQKLEGFMEFRCKGCAFTTFEFRSQQIGVNYTVP